MEAAAPMEATAAAVEASASMHALGVCGEGGGRERRRSHQCRDPFHMANSALVVPRNDVIAATGSDQRAFLIKQRVHGMISRTFLTAAAFAIALASAAHGQGLDMGQLHDALQPHTRAGGRPGVSVPGSQQPGARSGARHQNAAQMMPTLNAPRRVDLSVALMQADLDALQRRGAALKTFYATLTPAQQTTFDRQTVPKPQDDE